MSYTRKVGDMTVFVSCASNPEGTYETYYKDDGEDFINTWNFDE